MKRMKKFIFGTILFFVVISLLSGCGKKEPYVYEGVELLENGNLEEEDPKSKLPKGWLEIDDISYITDPENGNKYIKIESKMQKKNTIYVFQDISENIPYGKKLKYTVKIKTENLEGQGAAIAIRCDDDQSGRAAQFETTEGKIDIKGTSDWKYYTVELNERVRPDIKEITVYVLFLSNTTGTLYFDDASLIY